MSKRLTIVLTDEEYAFLEQRAQMDRRTVRQMVERLVTQPQGIQVIPSGGTDFNPYWPPKVWCGTTDATGTDLTKYTHWNGTNPTSGKLEAVG